MEQCPREYREIALSWWRQKKLLEGAREGQADARKLEREVDRLGRCVEAFGVAVHDYTGRPYGNLNVEAVAIEPDPAVESEVIFETITPEISYQGEMVQRSRVVVHKPGPAPAGVAPSPEVVSPPEVPSASACRASLSDQAPIGTDVQQAPVPAVAGMVESCAAAPKTLYALAGAAIIVSLIGCGIFLRAERSLVSRLEQIDASFSELEQDFEEQRETLAAVQEAVSAEEPEGAGGDAEAEELVLVEYEVKRGDTLVDICAEMGVDYADSIELICNLNGLDNPDSIIAGETLILPVSHENAA